MKHSSTTRFCGSLSPEWRNRRHLAARSCCCWRSEREADTCQSTQLCLNPNRVPTSIERFRLSLFFIYLFICFTVSLRCQTQQTVKSHQTKQLQKILRRNKRKMWVNVQTEIYEFQMNLKRIKNKVFDMVFVLFCCCFLFMFSCWVLDSLVSFLLHCCVFCLLKCRFCHVLGNVAVFCCTVVLNVFVLCSLAYFWFCCCFVSNVAVFFFSFFFLAPWGHRTSCFLFLKIPSWLALILPQTWFIPAFYLCRSVINEFFVIVS